MTTQDSSLETVTLTLTLLANDTTEDDHHKHYKHDHDDACTASTDKLGRVVLPHISEYLSRVRAQQPPAACQRA